jgi:hypothetical protein
MPKVRKKQIKRFLQGKEITIRITINEESL